MDLLTFFGFCNPLRTVWYIQAGTVDANGVFTCASQASAVLINIRKNDGTTRKVLVTARHGLCKILTRNPLNYGSVLPDFRAWAPGWILAKAPIKVLYSELSPERNSSIRNLNDLAFLELPDDQQGFEEAQLAENIQVRPRKGIHIIGFNGGLNPADDGFEIEAFDSRKWDFTGLDEGTRRAFLRNGIGGGAPGGSGGGVFLPFSIFRQPNLLGIYRGMEGMNNLFMPATWLRKHLETKDAEAIGRDWRVPSVLIYMIAILLVALAVIPVWFLPVMWTLASPLWFAFVASSAVVAVAVALMMKKEPVRAKAMTILAWGFPAAFLFAGLGILASGLKSELILYELKPANGKSINSVIVTTNPTQDWSDGAPLPAHQRETSDGTYQVLIPSSMMRYLVGFKASGHGYNEALFYGSNFKKIARLSNLIPVEKLSHE